MGTRSRIGYVNENGKIVSAYCHWDGYPSYNGKILLENYTTLAKVKKLVDQGDMSSLDKKCTKPKDHSFEKPKKGYTIYYHRDRGENAKKTAAITSRNIKEYLKAAEKSWGEYAYLFQDGKWVFSETGTINIRDLTPADCGPIVLTTDIIIK